MKRLSINVVLVSIVLLLSIYPQGQSGGNDQVAVNAAPVGVNLENEILNATVQIQVVALATEQGSDDQGKDQAGAPNKPEEKITTNLTKVTDLGTLVSSGQERWIVTHNHWGEMITETSFIEFSNAYGELLLAMSGVEFINLIRYQDQGTLLLKAPEAFNSLPSASIGAAYRYQKPVAADSDNTGMPDEGDIVLIVHPKSGEEDQIEVLQATVQSLGRFKGLPIVKVLVPNDLIIQRGNSGGGVWFNGHFIGNIWATELKGRWSWDTFQFNDTLTNVSYVAPFAPASLYSMGG